MASPAALQGNNDDVQGTTPGLVPRTPSHWHRCPYQNQAALLCIRICICKAATWPQVTSLPCLHCEDTEGGQEPLGIKGREPKAQNSAQAAMKTAASSPSLLETNQTPTQGESKAPDLPALVLEHPGRAHLSPARHRVGPKLCSASMGNA